MTELRRIENTVYDQPRYEVVVDGEVLGTVWRTSITVETRYQGQRYVHSRRESAPRYWSYRVPGQTGWTPTLDTRRAAVERLIRDARKADERN